MKSVVVTGASTGIGYACCKVLLSHGFRVFGSVRKQADADRLTNELGANITPLPFDVMDEAAVHAAAAQVRAALNGETLAGLVNNAGIAVVGPVLELPVADFRRQMDINVLGPVIATQAFGPLLGADRSLKGPPGRIVMMSSVAGRAGNPMMAPYSASKHALEGLSESLRRELMLFGIDVIIIGPGAVKTPIWDKSEALDLTVYSQSPFLPALKKLQAFMQQFAQEGLPAEAIGELVYSVLTIDNPKVRYAITPGGLRLLAAKVLPKRTFDRIMARRLDLLPKAEGTAQRT